MVDTMNRRLVPCWIFVILLMGTSYCDVKDKEDNLAFQAGNAQMPKVGQAKPVRYLLYDVNPGEGFNLRRDVYMRMANLVHLLNEDVGEPWVLVLPPWGPLYHWKSPVEQRAIPWATFFDLHSLVQHAPVIEFEEFLSLREKPAVIDEVYYMQGYAGGWSKWETKMDVADCLQDTGFEQDEGGEWRWHFWGRGDDVRVGSFQCLSIMAEYKNFIPFLTNTTGRAVMTPRAEKMSHGSHSNWSEMYWRARRSMVFAKHLRDIADEFRKTHLDSTDKEDRTELENWKEMKRSHGDALGGPYVAVHLRRRDFLRAHTKRTPALEKAARTIAAAMDSTGLKTVFIATDAPQEEFTELRNLLFKYTVQRYVAPPAVLDQYMDGGVAIIDQWICAHARYFVGTDPSTFTFRINEEREILGFSQASTYNAFCAADDCEPTTRWDIKY